MILTPTEKLFHQLHHCINLLHRGHAHHGHHEGHGSHNAHRGQGRIVSLLRAKDGLSQRELAEMLHIQPPSLSEVLNKLEENGLIERRQNEDDKRMSNVFLTAKGNETAAHVESARKNMAEELLSGFSQADQEQLSALLEKLTATLEAKATDATEHNGRHGECCGHGHHHGHHHHDGHHGHCGHHRHGNGCKHKHNADGGESGHNGQTRDQGNDC